QTAGQRPHFAGSVIGDALRLRLGATFLRCCREPLDDAGELAFQLGDARKTRGQAQERGIARVNSGYKRVGEGVGDVIASAPTSEGVDRLVARVEAFLAKAFP